MLLWVLCLLIARLEDNSSLIVSTNITGSAIISNHWCGPKNILITLTEDGGVYRSTNGGKKFDSITKLLNKKAKAVSGDDDTGSARTIELNQEFNNTIIIFGTEGVNWITHDCGANWDAINTDKPLLSIKFHPFNTNMILGAADAGICKVSSKEDENDELSESEEEEESKESQEATEEEEEESEVEKPKKKNSTSEKTGKTSKKNKETGQKECTATYDLLLSEDKGKTWKKIAENVMDFSWGLHNVNDVTAKSIPENRIIITKTVIFESFKQLKLEVSDDLFKTVIYSKNHISKFTVMKNIIYASEMLDYQTKQIKMYASMLVYKLQFYAIMLPDAPLKSHNYQIIDAEPYGVFIFVQHETLIPSGNLYKSDQSGIYFSLSLKKISYFDAQPQIRFIDGSDGVILANVYATKKKGEKPSMKTYISYNMGGSWSTITAPSKDLNNATIDCKKSKKCSLHLYPINMIVSSENALGLIIAYGKHGDSFQTDITNSLMTYMSRDAGRTWTHISMGVQRAAIGDHGSIIVLANQTNISYSWNEGITWKQIPQLTDSVKLDKISKLSAFPDSVTLKFLLVSNSENKKINISVIDFGEQNIQECVGGSDSDNDDSDYEQWSPLDEESENACLLGKKITYIRRKQSSECFNGEKFERKVEIKNCSCTDEDFECDYGFIRQKESSLCIKDTSIEVPQNHECLYGSQFYRISLGYRRIAGDTCSGGVSHEYTLAPCARINTVILYASCAALLLLVIAFVLVRKGVSCRICKKKEGYVPTEDLSKKDEKAKQNKKLDLIYNDEELNINDDDSKEKKP